VDGKSGKEKTFEMKKKKSKKSKERGKNTMKGGVAEV